MTMLPVADLIIIEHKNCRCGAHYEAPSPFRYRLFKSPTNEPDKTEIRKLKWEPSTSAEQQDLTPLDRRTIYHLDIPMDQCPSCWTPTIDHASACAIRPLPPITSMNGLGLAMLDAATRRSFSKEPKAAKKRSAFTLEDLAKGLGLS